MASQVPAVRGAAYTLYYTLYRNDGTVIANPGTLTKKVSKDGGALADIAASATEVDTTYGLNSIVLSISEMTADAVWVFIKDDTVGCVPYTAVIYTSGQNLNDIDTEVDNIYTRMRDGGDLDNLVDAIKAKTDAIPANPAAVGSAMALSTAERSSVALAVEQAIINDTDSAAVLTAITNKIAEVNPSLSGLTLAAIATQVRAELALELGRIDVAVTSRLASTSYTTPPTKEFIAQQVRTELATELGRIDAAVTSRLAPDGLSAVTNLIGTPVASVSADIAALALALGSLDTAHLDALLTAVAAIKLKTDLLGGLTLEVTGPVAEDGEVTIYSGDTIAADLGNAIDFNITSGVILSKDWSGAVCELYFDDESLAGTVVAGVGDAQTLRFTATAAQTGAWAEATYQYAAVVVFADSTTVTVATGVLRVVDTPA